MVTQDPLDSRPLALCGFMGAGKSTVGRLVATARGVPFVDADEEIERHAGATISTIFEHDGEARFRELEVEITRELVDRGGCVIGLGGGALARAETRALLRDRATVVWLDIDVECATRRVSHTGDSRPLVRDRTRFRALHAERAALYAAAADGTVDASAPAGQVARAVLQNVLVRPGVLDRLPELVGDRRVALIVDRPVADRIVLPGAVRIELPGGEPTKTVGAVTSLWHALADAGLERRDLVVAAGGGAVTDAAGFAAATFRRGVAWLAVPTTLVGQVDASIGGKTAIDVAAKNDVGAFHLPRAVLIDPGLLETLPQRQWAAGMGEIVKTALLAGGPLWELARSWGDGPGPLDRRVELVRRCAAYKQRIVAEDPAEHGIRAVLNLGHTIGHGVEAAAGYTSLLHGEAVAIGLVQTLRLSVEFAGLDPDIADEVEDVLRRIGLPTVASGLDPCEVERAMQGDKKRVAGVQRFVLLEAVGRPRYGWQLPSGVVQAAVRRAVGS